MRALLQPFVACVAGVLGAAWLAPRADVTSPWLLLPAAIGAVASITLLWRSERTETRRIASLLLGAFVGVALPSLHAPSTPGPSELTHRLASERPRGVLRGTVTSGPRLHARGWIWDVALHSIDGEPIGTDGGRVRLFAERSEHFAPDRSRPRPGDVVQLFAQLERYPRARFPERASRRRSMQRRGIVARGVVHDRIQVLRSRAGPLWWMRRSLTRLRLGYERSVLGALSDERAGIALAMTDGSRGLLDSETWRAFQQTGTAHLLAISGLHMGVLAGIVWWVLGMLANGALPLLRRWGRRRVCGCGVVGLLAVYVLAIGAPVSAARAWLMVTVATLALLVLRPLSSLHALAAAALGLVVVDPHAVETLGFQLSIGATFAILCFLERRPAVLEAPDDPTREESWRRRWMRRAGTAMGISLSATLATWPIIVAWTGALPIHALWLNLVVPPLVSTLIFPLLVAGGGLVGVVPSIGGPLMQIGAEAMLWMGDVLAAIADSPGAIWRLGTWPPWTAAIVCIGVVTWIASRLRPRPLATGFVLILLGSAAGLASVHRPEGSPLRIDTIPVGQGDAILVRTPGGESILVDGGGSRWGRDPGRAIVVPYLTRLGFDRLDWVIATHADIDHVGGLGAVAEAMHPRHLVYDGSDRSQHLRKLIDRMEAVGSRRHRVSHRWKRTIGDVRVEIVRPRPGEASDNDGSLVVRLSYGESSVLLAGDVERAGERWLVSRMPLRADVLKVPHHGSKTSSTPAFLEAVDPAVGVVSAGRFNPFGHPHDRVLRRYRARGVRLFQTLRHGLVRIEMTRSGRVTTRIRRPSSDSSP
jgi:competence protein ComEC